MQFRKIHIRKRTSSYLLFQLYSVHAKSSRETGGGCVIRLNVYI